MTRRHLLTLGPPAAFVVACALTVAVEAWIWRKAK